LLYILLGEGIGDNRPCRPFRNQMLFLMEPKGLSKGKNGDLVTVIHQFLAYTLRLYAGLSCEWFGESNGFGNVTTLT